MHTRPEKRALHLLHTALDLVIEADGRAAETLLVVRSGFAGHPRAASYNGDRVNGGTTVLDEHGTPMPARSDPTGEAAIRPDQAAAEHRTILALVARLYDVSRELADHLARHALHAPTLKDLRDTASANEKRCESCARIELTPGIPWDNYAGDHPRTTAKGNLGIPMALCESCYRFTMRTGVLPTRAELETRAARGKKATS
ncbi:MAG TPA: hypothetical protein VF640_00755 [Acidimicrobiales bacterium]